MSQFVVKALKQAASKEQRASGAAQGISAANGRIGGTDALDAAEHLEAKLVRLQPYFYNRPAAGALRSRRL